MLTPFSCSDCCTLPTVDTDAGRMLELARKAGAVNVNWDTEQDAFYTECNRILQCKMHDAVPLYYDYGISLERLQQISSWEEGATCLRGMREAEQTDQPPAPSPAPASNKKRLSVSEILAAKRRKSETSSSKQ